MLHTTRQFSTVLAFFLIACVAQGREWNDASGIYKIEADLIGFDDENVVLQRADKELGMLKIEQLSKEDRAYLKSPEAEDINARNIHGKQTWTTKSGLKLVGRVVDFARGDVTIQRRRGSMYVSDRRFSNLPELYQKLVPKFIEHFDEIEIPHDRALQNWLLSLRGRPRTFLLEGVILEMENGDEYAIPFFVFSAEDRKILKAGWANWRSVQDDYDERDDVAFRLESLAATHLQNQEVQQQIALMNLNVQAIRAGLTSAWEVTLYPAPGNPSPPRWVVTLGRDSDQASIAALQKNPGFVVGPVRRLNRR